MKAPYTKDDILTMLATNDFAVERALTVLFLRQTADEQCSESTHNRNGQGFTMNDANFMSSLAKRVMNSSAPHGKRLTPNMLTALRRTNKRGQMNIGKYWAQLLEVANSNAVMHAGA